MNRQKIIIFGVLIAITISMTAFAMPNSEQYVYTQSDITKANPNLVMGSGEFSMLEDIKYTKDTIVLTLSGTGKLSGDVFFWKVSGAVY